MKLTKATKKEKTLAIIFGILSYSLLLLPVIIYAITGFVNGTTTAKLCIGVTSLAAILLGIINVINKKHCRSIIWLVILGLAIALKNMTSFVVVYAATSIIDEFIVAPIYKKAKAKYTINKEIDKRGAINDNIQ